MINNGGVENFNLLLQDINLFEEKTLQEIEERAKDALTQVGLGPEFYKKSPFELSVSMFLCQKFVWFF